MERVSDVGLLGRRLIFGNGSVSRVGMVAEELGATRVMVIADPGVVGAGLIGQVLDPLRERGMAVSVFDDVPGEPPWSAAVDAATRIVSERCDFVVGVGGGSAMDVAKGASVLATLEEPVSRYWDGDRWSTALSKILIPTSAGTGSELSSSAVFTDVDGYKKAMRGAQLGARVAIVDPLLTLTLPPKATADSGMDALVHAIEAYTSRRSTPFGDIFAESAIPLIGASLAIAYRNGQDVVARYRMALGSATAGIAASMNGVGAVHALTYPLSTAARITHGLANALLLPHVVAYNVAANPPKFRQIARLLGEPVDSLPNEAGARQCAVALETLRFELGMPSRLRDVGIEQDAFERFVEYAFIQFRGNLEANARPLTREDALAIYRAAW